MRRGDSGSQVRLSATLHSRLTEEAGARYVSVQWLVDKLLWESIDRLVPADGFRLTRSDGVQPANP